MKNIFRTADVYVYNNFAGKLSETDEGYSFSYDKTYIKASNHPVSLTLPIREEPYKSKTLFSFFDGLIPEGWLLFTMLFNMFISVLCYIFMVYNILYYRNSGMKLSS